MNNAALKVLYRVDACCRFAAIPVLVIGMGGAYLYSQYVEAKHVEILERMAEINHRPATRAVHVDEEGVTRHTFCSGGGFCVTDSVPPIDPNAPEQRAKQTSFNSSINVWAICESAARFTQLELDSMRGEEAALVQGCLRLIKQAEAAR